ncbi:MAG: PQQ-binding-like beta-propeller repeat protein [Planctomycetota bacterium]
MKTNFIPLLPCILITVFSCGRPPAAESPPLPRPGETTPPARPGLATAPDPETSAAEMLTLHWTYRAAGAVAAPPAVIGDFIIVVTKTAEVTALSPAGQKRWSVNLGEARTTQTVLAAPAIAGGNLYLGTDSGFLYALDPATGKAIWTAALGAEIRNPPAAAENCLFVLTQPDGVIHALNPVSGAEIWKSEKTNRTDGPPATNGREIAFGNCDAALHVFSAADGKRLHRIELGEDSQVAGGAALSGNLAFVGTRNGRVVCADIHEGKIVWAEKFSEGEIFTTPAASGRRVVFAAADGVVHATDRDTGKSLWRFQAGNDPQSPVIAGDRAVVSAAGVVYILDLATGAKRASREVSDFITAPAVWRGMILVGTDDGRVVAFGKTGEIR